MTPPQSPKTFQGAAHAGNRYLFEEVAGSGGMGTVYRAFDVELKRHVALKVLKSLHPTFLERFVQEREITADLDHPNFVRILSIGYVDLPEGRRPFYTMPLLRGETLEEMIRRRRGADEAGERLREEFTTARLIQLVQQLCLALQSAHDRQIIHRDLKPANIMIGPYGELYVVDLGLAKYIHRAEEACDQAQEDEALLESLTPRYLAGTPYYVAPEQILDPLKVDARADIFGLGAILYYVLTGDRPHYRAAENGPARSPAPPPASPRTVFLRELQAGRLVPPDEHAEQNAAAAWREDINPALAAICTKAMSRCPADRYPSCRAMWQELQQYLEGRFEMILKREARDLTRVMTRLTLPNALHNYEVAERRLRQRIARTEKVGRLGIEEKLDLFDVLLEKASLQESRGDSASILRTVTGAEPVIETALEVLLRKHAQLLIAKGLALVDEGDPSTARTLLTRAVGKCLSHGLDDVVGSAYYAYGAACAAGGDVDEAQRAFTDAVVTAERTGAVMQSVRALIGLARLCLRPPADVPRALTHLEGARRHAEPHPALLAEVELALGSCHLAAGAQDRAMRHAETAIRHAREAGARALIRDAHVVLGAACHLRGNARLRARYFRMAARARGPRRARLEREIRDFYALHRLDPAEAGLASNIEVR